MICLVANACVCINICRYIDTWDYSHFPPTSLFSPKLQIKASSLNSVFNFFFFLNDCVDGSSSAFVYFFFKNIYLFLWLYQVLVVAYRIFTVACRIFFFFFFFSVASCEIFNCNMQTLLCGTWDLVPWPGIKPRPLHWEHGVLVSRPPGKPNLTF